MYVRHLPAQNPTIINEHTKLTFKKFPFSKLTYKFRWNIWLFKPFKLVDLTGLNDNNKGSQTNINMETAFSLGNEKIKSLTKTYKYSLGLTIS